MNCFLSTGRWVIIVSVLLVGVDEWLRGAERPNILWLTSEDHGPHMGCYGDRLARTPHVDALARKGMIFTHAWSCVPVCAPARTAIITGMYPSSTGTIHMRSMVPLPSGVVLFPQLLREAGYYCTNNVKEDYNVPKPPGTWDDSSQRAHWRNRKPGQPFFAVFNSTKSHESQIRRRPHRLVTDPNAVQVPPYHPDTPEVRHDWAQYYDQVSEADADAGRRLAELEEDGLAEDTIVFYFADHGSGMPRHKRWAGQSGLHVPMVVYFPPKWQHLAPREYQIGGKSDRLVNFVDLAPTVLSIAGIQPPPWMQGRAFAGPYQEDPPQYTFGERARMDECGDCVRSVTDGRYVYLRNYWTHVSHGQYLPYQLTTPTTRIWRAMYLEGKTNAAQSRFWQVPREPEELYDLANDPHEIHNLAGSPEHREVLERMRRVLEEHQRAIRDVALLPEGQMHERSGGGSPYDLARRPDALPWERIQETADWASRLEAAEMGQLVERLSDPDPTVRYWAVMGVLMHGEAAVKASESTLGATLKDPSADVRITAARALAQWAAGEPTRTAARQLLLDYADPRKNGLFAALAALQALESLGAQGSTYASFLQSLPDEVPGTPARYSQYFPRTKRNLLEQWGVIPPSWESEQ
ncbi:MAG: sulfatase [Pirellulaceae bacterium]|nr:MAG: sulfatase [Pirellulaceae bacterium]GIW92581.1 MAG: sulfatase [Pirellulaceae bacterium]